MENVQITKNEYDKLKNRYESDRKAQLNYMKKFKQYSLTVPRNQANLLEQIAKKYGFKTARQMLQFKLNELVESELKSIEKSIF